MNCTFDSNVLVYVLVKPPDLRGHRARQLLARSRRGTTAALLFQTLGEFSHVAIRKLDAAPGDIRRRLLVWRRVLPVVLPAENDVIVALDLLRLHSVPFWDALLCATASRAGIPYLLSEDFQDGRRFGAVTIVNPFRPENDALIDRILPG